MDIEKSYLLETDLLKAMAKRKNYERFNYYLSDKYTIQQTKVLLNDYAKYFDSYPEHKKIDFGIFATHFINSWHSYDLTEEDKQYYCENILPKLQSEETTEVKKVILDLVSLELKDKIANSEFDPEEIKESVKKYCSLKADIMGENDLDVFDIEALDFTKIDPSGGIPFPYPSLNNHFGGGMVQGQLILVTAASGVGKTAFCFDSVNECLMHLKKNNDDRPILYFNSEGSSEGVIGRLFSNVYKNKLENGYRDVVKSKDKVLAHFIKAFGKGRIKLYNHYSKPFDFIRQKIEKYKPAMVIVDMIDTIQSPKGGHTANSYELLYQSLRDLANNVCPIVGTTQAGDTAKWFDPEQNKTVYKRWLIDKDLYGSNSGKQGAADTIIGIGLDDPNDYKRYVKVIKDKVGMGECRFTCTFAPQFSSYSEIE